MYNPVVLDPKDILQADATVIAGFLVLLTILFVFAPDVEIAPIMRWVKVRISIVAMIIIGLFSFSAILLVLGDWVLFDVGKYLTMFGFGAPVVGIGVILWQFRKAKII